MGSPAADAAEHDAHDEDGESDERISVKNDRAKPAVAMPLEGLTGAHSARLAEDCIHSWYKT